MWFTIYFLLTSILWSVANVIFTLETRKAGISRGIGVDSPSFDNFSKSILENEVATATTAKSKYTSEENSALDRFRPLALPILELDYERTDQYLIRWLRACDLKVKSAMQMLREAQQWRRDNGINNILNETVMEFKNGCVLDGTDLDGNPLAIVSLLGHDIRKLVMAGHQADMVRYMNQFLEKTEAKIRELSDASPYKNITQAVTLLDANGYNIKQHSCYNCIRLYMDFLRSFEQYHPELNRFVVIINAPAFAKPLIRMAQPILSKNSQRAVKIFGLDRNEWRSFLLSIIAPDELPVQFGGTKVLAAH